MTLRITERKCLAEIVRMLAGKSYGCCRKVNIGSPVEDGADRERRQKRSTVARKVALPPHALGPICTPSNCRFSRQTDQGERDARDDELITDQYRRGDQNGERSAPGQRRVAGAGDQAGGENRQQCEK